MTDFPDPDLIQNLQRNVDENIPEDRRNAIAVEVSTTSFWHSRSAKAVCLPIAADLGPLLSAGARIDSTHGSTAQGYTWGSRLDRLLALASSPIHHLSQPDDNSDSQPPARCFDTILAADLVFSK